MIEMAKTNNLVFVGAKFQKGNKTYEVMQINGLEATLKDNFNKLHSAFKNHLRKCSLYQPI